MNRLSLSRRALLQAERHAIEEDGGPSEVRVARSPSQAGEPFFFVDRGHGASLRLRLRKVRLWPIATDDALTANRRFRGIADMGRFSSRNDL
jgi:hypothetical protein